MNENRIVLRMLLGIPIFIAFYAICIQLGVWISDRGPATHVFGRDILTPRVAPGSEYVHVNDFTRLKYCGTIVRRWLIDLNGKHHDLETLVNALQTTGGLNVRQKTEARIRLPLDMPEGKAELVFQPEWRCNPIDALFPIKGPEEHIPFIVDKGAPPPPPPMIKKSA